LRCALKPGAAQEWNDWGISHGQAQKSQEKNLAKTTSFPFVEAEMFTNIKFSFSPECKLVVHLLGRYSSF